MKNLKLTTVAVALMISSLSFASIENPNTKVKNQLHTQIVSILGSSVEKIAEGTIEAEVSFTLNSDSEIVILSVKSNNTNVETLVKNKLNYKKVNVKALNEGEVYKMPLKIVNN